MMMIYLPVKFEFRLDKAFSSYSPETEMLTDTETDKKQTNERTELHQFRKLLSYDGERAQGQIRHTKRLPGHDFLQVGLPSQTARINNK